VRWRRDRIYQAENIHALRIRVVLNRKHSENKGKSMRKSSTHNSLESADFLLLSYHASPSTTSSTDGFMRVFTVYDTFHDFAEEGNALSIGDNGAIRVVVRRIELDSFTSQFKRLCQGSTRGWPRTLGRWLGIARGKGERI
jgi:hypothetical protein